MNKFILHMACLFLVISEAYSQQQEDTVNVNTQKFILISENLIPNPGFEKGFTGWTDGTSAAQELTSTYFSIAETGGIDNSKYLIGTTNSGKTSAGSIGTGWEIEAGKTYYFSYDIKYENPLTDPVPELWLKVSLNNALSNTDEPSILIDTTWVNSGGEWTHTAIAFTNTSSYNYIFARFRWLNNRFGFDNFALHEVSEIADITGLQAVIDEALLVYDETANGATEFQTAISNAQNKLSDNSAEEVRQAISDLTKAIMDYKILNASQEAPLELTNYIVNPGFESNFEGWLNDGMATQTNSLYNGKEGNVYVEKWVSRGSSIPDISIQQLITEIPNGKYILTAASGNIQQSASGSNLNNSETPQTGVSLFAGNVETAVDTVKDRSVVFEVYEGKVNIGLKAVNATGNWVTCDNFRLYYMGFDIEDVRDNLQNLVNEANALLENKMQDSFRASLVSAINSAEEVILDQNVSKEIMADTIQLLQNKIQEANSSTAAYNELQVVIDEASAIYGDGNGNEAAKLQTNIDIAIAMSNNYSVSTDAVNQATADLKDAIFTYKLANASGEAPIVTTKPEFARGSTMIFARSIISGVSASSLLEHGFCWSTHSEPTIHDNRSTKYYSKNGNLYCIDQLEPSTVYYIRAYAITNTYAVGYGEVIKVITIPKGTVSYTLSSNVTGDHRIRIDKAMAAAVDYYNNLTSIKNHWLNVNYGSGTPTAEASYGGYMRFGPNPAYQQIGTALHEMAHTIGVGTHSMWYGPSSPLRETGSRGEWLGVRTKRLLEFIDNDPSSYLTGDHIHMWPYGINGTQEDDGTELLYITNSLIVQALGEDGLPPTGGFATPAYSFEIDDTTVYYLKNEDDQHGLNTSYIVAGKNGKLVNRVLSSQQVVQNDSAAWQLAYNPVNCYYTIKNVATEEYFTYKTAGLNGIGTVSKENAASAEYFQLMEARVVTELDPLVKKGYWIIHPEAKSAPACFAAYTGEQTMSSAFNISNSFKSQRWLFLTKDEISKLDSVATSNNPVSKNSSSDILVYARDNQINVRNIQLLSNIRIYNISGELMVRKDNIRSSYTQYLPKGIYFVVISSDSDSEVKKVILQ